MHGHITRRNRFLYGSFSVDAFFGDVRPPIFRGKINYCPGKKMAHVFFDLGCSKFEESSDFYFSSRRAWFPSVTTYMKTLGGGIMTNDRTLRKYSIKSYIMSYSLKKGAHNPWISGNTTSPG